MNTIKYLIIALFLGGNAQSQVAETKVSAIYISIDSVTKTEGLTFFLKKKELINKKGIQKVKILVVNNAANYQSSRFKLMLGSKLLATFEKKVFFAFGTAIEIEMTIPHDLLKIYRKASEQMYTAKNPFNDEIYRFHIVIDELKGVK